MKAYRLTCLICDHSEPGLVPMQEHAMNAHGYTQDDHQNVKRRPVHRQYGKGTKTNTRLRLHDARWYGLALSGEVMNLHAAALVFDTWKLHPEYPDQVGEIRCCGQTVIQRAGRIACDRCQTAIEQDGAGWRIVKVTPLEDRPK